MPSFNFRQRELTTRCRKCSSSTWQSKATTWPSSIESHGGTYSIRTCVRETHSHPHLAKLADRLLAAAVIAKDNLEFLDDTIPKTQPYKEIKHKAAETRAKLQGGKTAGEQADEAGQPNGKKQKSINGFGVHDVVKRAEDDEQAPVGPADGDVHMTG